MFEKELRVPWKTRACVVPWETYFIAVHGPIPCVSSLLPPPPLLLIFDQEQENQQQEIFRFSLRPSSLQILPFIRPEDQTPESQRAKSKDASKKCNFFFTEIVQVRP